MNSIFEVLDPLMEFKPPFIDVTYHREEFVYQKSPNGFYEKVSIRKRPGTVGICAALMHRYGVDAVPHLICGGFSKEDTENALIDLNFLNINNVLALRGDARKFDGQFIPEPSGNEFALDLVKQITAINKGHYLDSNIENGAKMDFCVGIAGYPEKHFEAPNLATDIKYLKAKVDAGADYIVTQMFYDNQKYFAFVELLRQNEINVPVVPGLKPITKKSQITSLPRMFHINLPNELVLALEAAKSPQALRQTGIEWCIAQSKELKKMGTPCLHYYTMGDWETTKAVVEKVF